MEIANADNLITGRHTPATHTATGKSGSAVNAAAEQDKASIEVPADAEPHQLASVQALVAGLRGDFAELGIVPPPKKYAGLDVVSQSEIAQARSEQTPASVGSLDTMRIILVKGILARLANEQADGTTANDAQAKAAARAQLDLAV